MNKFSKNISIEDLYLEFLQALRGVLKLTDREIKILVEIIKFDINYEPVKDEPKNVIDENCRFLIQQKTGISRANLSTVIKSLKEKGCIVTKKDITEVNKSLIPDVIRDRVQIILLLKMPID